MKITLKAARVNAGLTQQELADYLIVDRTTVHNWETGKSVPRADMLRKISVITNISENDFLLPERLEKNESADGSGEEE